MKTKLQDRRFAKIAAATALAVASILALLAVPFLSPEVRAHNITVSRYEAGQMTYLDNKELVKLQRDLATFLSGAGSRK